jgi:hypothetical protein
MKNMDDTSEKRKKKDCVRVKIRLLERGWTYKDLARKIGRDAKQVGNVIYGNTTSWPIRKAINAVLRESIFPKPSAAWMRRKRKVGTPRRGIRQAPAQAVPPPPGSSPSPPASKPPPSIGRSIET